MRLPHFPCAPDDNRRQRETFLEPILDGPATNETPHPALSPRRGFRVRRRPVSDGRFWFGWKPIAHRRRLQTKVCEPQCASATIPSPSGEGQGEGPWVLRRSSSLSSLPSCAGTSCPWQQPLSPMKPKRNQCPLTPPGSGEPCPLTPATRTGPKADPPAVVVVRTERRSWFTLAITGFGALLLRYLRTVRERARTTKRR
jgi:hypothetical protein